jgi:hypothetical protein
MSDRTKAMDNLIAQDADLIDDRDVLTPVYLTGFENGRESERAKIVAYLLNEQREYPRTEYAGFAAMIAEDISAKEHLK